MDEENIGFLNDLPLLRMVDSILSLFYSIITVGMITLEGYSKILNKNSSPELICSLIPRFNTVTDVF